MANSGLQISAKLVSTLLAQLFEARHPPVFDDFPIRPNTSAIIRALFGPSPEPWDGLVGLEGRHLQPWHAAFSLADVHIQELRELDRLAGLGAGEIAPRTLERGLSLVAELDELCPRWPRWPRRWPPGPPPPPWQKDEMAPTELMVFGMRFLAASDVIEQPKLHAAAIKLGEKAVGLSMRA